MNDADESQDSNNPIALIDSVAPEGWRKKLTKVLFQLIAGTEKGAAVYASARDKIDTIEGRSLVDKALANAVAEQAIRDPEVMERAKARFLNKAYQQQENMEAVVIGASQYLPVLPPPVTRPDESEPVKTDSAASAEQLPLNPDWAATFTGLAENANTEELRDRLSRVLAGELASPGRYSRATIRAIAELEKSDLELMKKAMPYIFGGELVKVFDDGQLRLHDFINMADAGLLTEGSSTLTRNSRPAQRDGELANVVGTSFAMVYR